jgi:histidyl-tRNA synthetase
MSDLLSSDQKGMEGLGELSEIIQLADGLGSLEKRVKVDFTLVRGLDYYTGPIFEIKMISNKQMGSVAGGGRYDELIELYGGNCVPAVGIGFGIERIADTIENDLKMSREYIKKRTSLFVIYLRPELMKYTLNTVERLRDSGIYTDFDLIGRSLKNQLSYADKMKYQFVMFIGDKEIKEGRYTLKNMETGIQSKIELEDIIIKLSDALKPKDSYRKI